MRRTISLMTRLRSSRIRCICRCTSIAGLTMCLFGALIAIIAAAPPPIAPGPPAAAPQAAQGAPTNQQPQQADSRGTFVIIFAEPLKPAADEWAAYRATPQGGNWNVVQHSAPATADEATQLAALRELIRQTYHQQPAVDPAQFAVLLLGDADAQSHSGSGIATWHFPQTDPLLQSKQQDNNCATDHPYQLTDDADDVPDIALGRVPAQTLDEARAVLDKIKHYEEHRSSVGGGRNRITYAAGEGHFGVMDNLFETLFKTMVDRMVPDAFELSMTYAKPSSIYCPPPSRLTETVLARLGEGGLLFNYIGHGHPTGLDVLHWNGKRYPILRAVDLKRLPQLPGGGQRPIAFLSCCSVGSFDLPKHERSLAEAMLFHPAGPIAVIAGSRITHPYANTVLQMDMTKALLVDRAATAGMLDVIATRSLFTNDATVRELDMIAAPIAYAGKWKTSLADLRKMHAKLYNLLGDPATRLALPDRAINALTFANNVISGTIEDMKTGRITITAETIRTSMAQPEKMQAVNGDNDRDLETKAANNYALVNDRVLARFEGPIVDGRFTITLPGPLPSAAAVLRAYAVGANGMDDNPIDAVGALRLAPPQSNPSATRH